MSYHLDMRRLSLILAGLAAACATSPWYSRYGITSEQQLGKASAVPGLIRALRSNDVDDIQRAGEALARIGAPAVEPLAGEVERGSQTAAWSLGQMGAAAGPGVAALQRALSHPERRMRQTAVEALGKIGAPARGAVPALLGVLRGDARRRVRKRVPDTLVRIGVCSPEVLAGLSRAAAGSSHRVRRAARKALEQLRVAAAASNCDRGAAAVRPGERTRPSRAPTPKTRPAPVLAVFDIQDSGAVFTPQERDGMTDYLAAQLAASGRFQIVPRGRLRARLASEKSGTFRDCYDERCQIELGKALAAQETLATRLLRVGPRRCTLTSMIYDLRRETSARAASAEQGCSKQEILVGLRTLAQRLAASRTR